MRRLRDSGMAILFVTHFLDQVYAVSRSHHRAAQRPARGRIPGRGARPCRAGRGHGGTHVVPRAKPRPERRAGAADTRDQPPVLSTRDLARRGSVSSVNLEIRPGEILGLAGLLGSGRTEVARLLFGLDRADAGEIRVNGQPVSLANPAQAIAHQPRLLPGRAQDRGHRRRSLDSRQHRADAAGAHGAVAQAARRRSAANSPTGSRACSTSAPPVSTCRSASCPAATSRSA